MKRTLMAALLALMPGVASAQRLIDMPLTNSLNGTELLYVVQGGLDKAVTSSTLTAGVQGCPLTGCTFTGGDAALLGAVPLHRV